MAAIMKIGYLMAIVCIANIAPGTTQSYSQGSFSSSSDDRISIYYSSSSGSSSFSVNGYGTADKCTHSGKFILAGSSYDINGKTSSTCIEGTLGLEDKSWTISGRSGNKSLTGNGNYKLDSSSGSYIMGSFDVPKDSLSVTDSGFEIPAVCGELSSMSSSGSDNQDFSFSWSGTTEWDDDSTVSWSASGSKSSGSEYYSISGSIMSTTNGYNGYSNSPTGCLTSLKIDNVSDSFTGSGHINGRGLQVSGRLHSGMYIADMVSLLPATDLPSFTGSFYFYQGSDGSFSSSSMSTSVSGQIFGNGTWTTLLPGNTPSGDTLTGTYSAGMFQGTGKISYMDATVSGQYGATCWFTDSVMVTCPTIAPETTNNYNFYNGSFYLCGTTAPGAVNKTQLMASGWMFTAKNQSDPMQLTAEAITVTAETENNDPSSSEEQSVSLSITDSAGTQSTLSVKGYLSTYYGQISGSLSNDKVSVSLMNSKSLGSNLVLMGTMMNM